MAICCLPPNMMKNATNNSALDEIKLKEFIEEFGEAYINIDGFQGGLMKMNAAITSAADEIISKYFTISPRRKNFIIRSFKDEDANSSSQKEEMNNRAIEEFENAYRMIDGFQREPAHEGGAVAFMEKEFSQAGKRHVYGEMGRCYVDARKCEKIKSGVSSVYVVDHPLGIPELYSMGTTMRGGGAQTVEQVWYIDSGATIHVCDSRAKFQTYTSGSGGIRVVVANNAQAQVAGIGTVLLRLTTGESVILKNVLHVPTVNKCLISVSQLGEDGYGVNFEGREVVIYKNGRVIGDGCIERGMYRLNINNGTTGGSTSGIVFEAR